MLPIHTDVVLESTCVYQCVQFVSLAHRLPSQDGAQPRRVAVVSAAARRDDEAHALRVALAVHHRHAGARRRVTHAVLLSAEVSPGRTSRSAAADVADAV